MRQLELRQLQGNNGIIDYRDILLIVVTRHPQGITLDTMEMALRVKAALTKSAAGGTLKLEDADWETLVSYLKVYPFAIADENLVTMYNDVINAASVEIK